MKKKQHSAPAPAIKLSLLAEFCKTLRSWEMKKTTMKRPGNFQKEFLILPELAHKRKAPNKEIHKHKKINTIVHKSIKKSTNEIWGLKPQLGVRFRLSHLWARSGRGGGGGSMCPGGGPPPPVLRVAFQAARTLRLTRSALSGLWGRPRQLSLAPNAGTLALARSPPAARLAPSATFGGPGRTLAPRVVLAAAGGAHCGIS